MDLNEYRDRIDKVEAEIALTLERLGSFGPVLAPPMAAVPLSTHLAELLALKRRLIEVAHE